MNYTVDNKQHEMSKGQKTPLDTQLSDHEIRNLKNEGKFRPEYVALLEAHLQENSFPSFAGLIKVNSTTLYLWLKKYPEFSAVHKKYKRSKTKLYA